MDKELVISSHGGNTEIALLENRKLVELHKQKSESVYNVGDVFLGQVRKLMPGLNAAFVDIGHSKEAFLHYTDMGPLLNSNKKFCKDTVNGVQTSPMLDQFVIQEEINKNGKVAQTGTVAGKGQRLEETSRFVREDGLWFYVDGDIEQQ